ncbi:sugar phosphate isomerase/epimerase [Siphonobacter sp. SORGH_AS_1065]|uniref:sugar phosphate isomerase/epimerase family protein n=1 Tax=Siphonobacter sp. SORGH_AS_1065 TaxID=3041795 RepID=UPI002780DCC8|nr:sugar phosphate isomerase/epimerase family protein [Siphonobacter sp. SORGH_AS_1065]MDQ1085506.1 sugar phosphate isomerase/epimerase [Siphonobacter sp. SORGH_AS_1065]
MKIGIDSYCYHRLFGEVYAGQNPPAQQLTFEDFLTKTQTLSIDGVSLESCFIPQFDAAYLQGIKRHLDQNGLDRVYAWGHPDGLEGGKNEQAFEEMIEHIAYASQIGAPVMRVVGSSLMFRFEPHEPQLEKLTRMFSEATKVAEQYGVKLAVENHIDYNSDEILQLIKGVNSPYFGVNFDSGNFLRVLDDPIQAMEKLAPYVLATHIKDLKPVKGVPVNAWYFFSCVPTGEGLIPNEKLAEILHRHDYQGFLAVEVDFLHPDYTDQEEEVVKQSIQALRNLTQNL